MYLTSDTMIHKYLEVWSSNLGPSIIDGDSEGKGGGVHTSKRKVDYLGGEGSKIRKIQMQTSFTSEQTIL